MPHIEIAAEKLFFIFGFPVTNTLVTSWIVMGILIGGAFVISRRVELIPHGLQNLFESFCDGFLNLMQQIFGNRKKAEEYFPLIATVFLFILISNWLGIFPGVGSIGFYEQVRGEKFFTPIFRSAASDLNVTLALATVMVFLIHISGMAALGVRAHLSKFFSLKGPIEFFVGILELVSEFAKIISFSFRLFGNIFAGEVLLIVTGFLAPFIAPLPFLALEIFVGFVQALVFAMLSMVFISIAVAEQH